MYNHSKGIELFMKKIVDKRASFLIVGIANLLLISYLIVLLSVFLKVIGHNDPIGYQFVVINQIIDEYSSLEPDNSFVYKNVSEQGEEVIKFSSSGDSSYLGTYDPYTYIYGTNDDILHISFRLSNARVSKVVFNHICLCDEDGENVESLSKMNYTVSKKNGWFTAKYSKEETKYIYSVSLTYYL